MRTRSIIVLVHNFHIVFGLVNLSVNKSADMSTSQFSDKWLADEAVDGDVSQDVQDNSCAVTLYGLTPEAWWRVDLGDVYVINSVTVYNRKETSTVTFRLSGFSLYVSDTLNWLTGILCYQDNNGEQSPPYPSDVLTVPCNATGRYVTLYKRRAVCTNPNQPQYCTQFELCEVQVFGCEDGTYGASCQQNCSGNCLNGWSCNKAHGGCDNGCSAGYNGFRCDEVCKNGFFGMRCSSSCGKCFNSSCNHIDGSCLDGCSAGWEGFYCNETCDIGTYGPNCAQHCSQHCSTEAVCHSINGTCYSGCKPGWMTHNCHQRCPFGQFGPNCESICSAHCVENRTCNIENGFCEGCTEGWMGNFCNQTCGHGHFGRDCLHTCSTCRNSSCNSINGLCYNGCVDGYNGTFCSIWKYAERDTLLTDKESNSIVIILIVTNILTILSLVTSVSLLCRYIRNLKNPPNTQQNRQGTSNLTKLPANPHYGNESGHEASYQPRTRNIENSAYEGLHLNITDTNTYEMLQTERNVAYTNTQLI